MGARVVQVLVALARDDDRARMARASGREGFRLGACCPTSESSEAGVDSVFPFQRLAVRAFGESFKSILFRLRAR
jgi:hypothetical protein